MHSMVIGVLRVELSLPGSQNLKDKRRLIQSLLDRLHNQFNVAAAEVDFQDNWQRAQLAVACVSNEGRHADQVLSRVMTTVQREPELVVLEYETEVR